MGQNVELVEKQDFFRSLGSNSSAFITLQVYSLDKDIVFFAGPFNSKDAHYQTAFLLPSCSFVSLASSYQISVYPKASEPVTRKRGLATVTSSADSTPARLPWRGTTLGRVRGSSAGWWKTGTIRLIGTCRNQFKDAYKQVTIGERCSLTFDTVVMRGDIE